MGGAVRGVLAVALLAGLGAVAFSWAAPVPVGGDDLVPAVVASRRAVRIVDVERRGPAAGTWSTVRSATSAGEDELPAWPAPSLGRHERLGARTARYTVTYRRESGLTHTAAVDSAAWSASAVGGHAALRLNSDGTPGAVLPADSLAQCRRWRRDPAHLPPPDSMAALGCNP